MPPKRGRGRPPKYPRNNPEEEDEGAIITARAGGAAALPVQQQQPTQLPGHEEELKNSLISQLSSPQASSISLPVPSLTWDFRLACQLNPRISVGKGPFGQRNWISFKGGDWSARWGHGSIVPGGQDNQVVTAGGSISIDTSYLLETSDKPTPAYITVKTSGWRTGPPDVIKRLMDPTLADHVKPEEYKFRLFVSLESGDERYQDLNAGMWIASAARLGAQVVYDAYRIQ